MRNVARIGAASAAMTVLTLSGCAGPGESPAGTPTSTPTVLSANALDLNQFTPAPSGVVDEYTGETFVPQPVATWNESSRTAAIDAARVAMTAFARPSLDFDTWWTELSPLLTQQAQQDYTYVDPANVPASTVTGPCAVVDETSAYVAVVEVPTDVGTYTLVLTRIDGQAPWLTSRFTPPRGIG